MERKRGKKEQNWITPALLEQIKQLNTRDDPKLHEWVSTKILYAVRRRGIIDGLLERVDLSFTDVGESINDGILPVHAQRVAALIEEEFGTDLSNKIGGVRIVLNKMRTFQKSELES
jgi:hypothetical protein